MAFTRGCFLIIVLSACGQVICNDVIILSDLTNATIWTGPVVSDGYLDLTPIPSIELYRPVAVDYDPVEGKLYWTDITRSTISRANLDGSDQEIVISFLDVPNGLAIDSVNRVLYWGDYGSMQIEKANLDGTGRMVIIDTDIHRPRAIVVDPIAGFLYWTDWGNHSKIERTNLNGTDRVIFVDTDLIRPSGLALDYADQRLYWCDPGLDRIESVDFNGENRINLFDGYLFPMNSYDLAISGHDIFWTDWRYYNLLSIDKYAGAAASLRTASPPILEQGGGVHIANIPPQTTIRPTTPTSPTMKMPSTTTKIPSTYATSELPADPEGPETIVIIAAIAGGAGLLIAATVVIIVLCCLNSRKRQKMQTSVTYNDSNGLYMDPYASDKRAVKCTSVVYDDSIEYNPYSLTN